MPSPPRRPAPRRRPTPPARPRPAPRVTPRVTPRPLPTPSVPRRRAPRVPRPRPSPSRTPRTPRVPRTPRRTPRVVTPAVPRRRWWNFLTRPRFTRPRFTGRMDAGVTGSISELKSVRRQSRRGNLIAGAALGASAAAVSSYSSISKGSDIRDALVSVLATTALAAVTGTQVARKLRSRDIHVATNKVGRFLQSEVRGGNRALRDFLNAHRYVYIDGKGNITGTRLPRFFGIGRLRLESKMILDHKF